MSLRFKHVQVDKYEVDVKDAKDLKTVIGELEAAGIDLSDFRIDGYYEEKSILNLVKKTVTEVDRGQFRIMQQRNRLSGTNPNVDVFGDPAPLLGYLRK